MSRPAPLFAIGEMAILVTHSKAYSHLMGTEVRVISPPKMHKFKDADTGIFLGEMRAYKCEPQLNKHGFIPERSLRKKYPPSTESFDQLMQGLKRPQGVVV